MVKVRALMVLALFALAVCFSGCQQPPTTATPTPTPTPTTPVGPSSLTIASGTVGGVYIYYCSGLATIYSKYLNISANAVQTKASVDNLLYVYKSPSDTIGIALIKSVDDAWNGKLTAFENKSQDWIRVLWVPYTTPIHIVTTADSGIKTVYDLKGKKVSTSAPGSGTEVDAFAILSAAGIDPAKDFSVWQRLGAQESADALLDGKIDAYFWSGTIPTASVSELATNLKQRGKQIAFVEVPDDVVKKLNNIYPGLYVPDVMKKEYYGSPADVQTVTTLNVMFCHKDLSEDFVYKLVKTTFEHLDELYAVHPAAKQTTLENAVLYKGNVPYHPGAIKFFKEKGVWK
ncbi:MAG: TAXI family TRAP transporter solute-binding subunit [Archaeoglobaceae archaeon]